MGMNRKWNMKVFELHDNEYALTTTVMFTISDGDTPIQNATVTLGSLTGTTDENGNCSFDNISLGEYEISVVIDGYQTISDTIIVTGDDTTFSISLEQEVETAILQFTYDANVNQTFSSYNSSPFTFTGELEIDYGDGSTEVVTDNQSLSHTYSDTDTYTVTISGNITALNDSCFFGWGGLTDIIIPSTVTTLGSSCFMSCTNLTDINIPSTITNIGAGCFAESGLVEIDIPSSITTIANGMFTRCYDLTTINLPLTLTSIGDGCFDGCSSLNYISIPNNVSNIGVACFQDSGLISIDIPSNITNLSTACFYNCTNLTNVNALGVTSVGNACFTDCSSLESIYLSDNIISFNTSCFQKCSNLRSISFSDNTTSLGESSFDGCDSLTSISIPTNITSIGHHCFVNCNNLTDCQLYWEENIPIQYRNVFCLNSYENTNIIFTIPYGTTSLYVEHGFPDGQLVERSDN